MNAKPTASMPRRRVGGIAIWLTACLFGCATPGPYDVAHDFEDVNDSTVFQLESRRDGIVVVEDGRGEKLCVVTRVEAGVKLEGAHGEALGSVVSLPEGRGYEVLDASGREVYKLLIEADGDFKVRSAAGRELYVGKQRSYGFKVMNAADQVESRVKVYPGRVSIRDGDDKKYLSAKVPDAEPMAMAVLTLKDIPFSYAAGLSVALTQARSTPEGATRDPEVLGELTHEGVISP